MTKLIKVKFKDKSYPVIIGGDSLQKVIETINKSSIPKCLLIIDKNVLKYHSLLIRKEFALSSCKVFIYSFSANEKGKSLQRIEKIYKVLSDNSFDRNSMIVAIGGGITGDIVGFVASTYMRGIKFMQVPTTLLSMVDSSVGGKTGVNFNHQKNIIGSFYQPDFVAIHSGFLSTLPKRELQSGTGEIFKYAFLADEKNYNFLKNSLFNLYSARLFDIEKTIFTCLKIKTSIVENDEKETIGLRKILNLGHTFAHAFEVQSNYKLKHGEAVIGGIYCSLFLSESLGFLPKERLKRFLDDFAFIKPKKELLRLNSNLVFQSMKNDKKNSLGRINFVLVEEIGNIVVDAVTEKLLVLDSIERMKKLIRKKKSL